MYMFGGVTGTGDSEKRVNSVHRIWLTVPTLQEMVWQSLADKLFKNHSQTLKQELVDYGVPRHLTARLS